MLKKDESDNTDVTSAAKKVLVGIVFIVVVPALVTNFAGVDIFQVCTVDSDTGACTTSDNKFFIGDAKALMVMIVDLFFLLIGIAIAIGPGISIIKYRLVPAGCCSRGCGDGPGAPPGSSGRGAASSPSSLSPPPPPPPHTRPG